VKLIINSPAKINFGLFITEKRSDGFHNIETVYYPLELCDEVVIQACDRHIIETDSDELNKAGFENNLIFKAILLMEKKSGKKLPARISLKKRIPLGAGLGGGSSNAASVLLGLNDLFRLGYGKKELEVFGAELGSDVPFFIHPYPSFGEGRGEILTELEFELTGSLVVVNPGIFISTSEAYAGCRVGAAGYNLRELNKRKISDYKELRMSVKNVFEDTVFVNHPEIAELKEQFYDNGAEFALMSGSGSTVFGIFNNNEKAEAFVRTLPQNYFVFSQEL